MTAIYREPLFLLFPVLSIIIGTLAFLAFALPLSWLAIADPPSLRRYRLQHRPEAARRAFAASLARLALNLGVMLLLAFILWPLLRLAGVHAGGLPRWHEPMWQLPLFVVLDDAGFYVLHRLMHTRWLYRRIHAVHHRHTAPAALAGGYFHPVEYALINLVALTGPLLVGAHVITIWIWAILRQWLAADGHSGFDLPWSPGRLLPFYPGPAYHDRHHQRFVGNYANLLTCLDRWCGTAAAREASRPSAPTHELPARS